VVESDTVAESLGLVSWATAMIGGDRIIAPTNAIAIAAPHINVLKGVTYVSSLSGARLSLDGESSEQMKRAPQSIRA
jgi:hypothetical protein